MKKFFATFLILVFMCSLVGCTNSEADQTPPTTESLQEQLPEENMSVNLIDIDETKSYSNAMRLVYDSETKIVYYYQFYSGSYMRASNFCPYYSANGYICRYNTETNQIEEIIH